MNDLNSIINKIRAIGPVLPGSLDSFYNVCGKPGCRCKDKQNPRKHGPYYRLSYSLAGRNSSMYVKQEDVDEARRMVDNYKKLRALTLELALVTLDSVRDRGVSDTLKLVESSSGRAGAVSWKEKCRQRVAQLKAAAVKIRDLTNSRDKWRQECLQLRKIVKKSEDKHSGNEDGVFSEQREKK